VAACEAPHGAERATLVRELEDEADAGDDTAPRALRRSLAGGMSVGYSPGFGSEEV
jgi:hypothetical protein